MPSFSETGWQVFEADAKIIDWVRAAIPLAEAALEAPALSHWYVCENTWFVGVDALANDQDGRLGDVPLSGAAIDHLSPMPPLHKAQLSVTWPGYPKPRAGESDAGFRYRLKRDAAHVDGVRGEGNPKRRFVREPHAFILGLPLNEAPKEAAPLVVWEGSHHIMRRAFADVFAGHDPADWGDIDVTDVYVAARRTVFETCTRRALHAHPGQAILVHRLALHGVAPWAAPDQGRRMIAYFRPELSSVADWLSAD